MNIQVFKDQLPTSTGERLRQARENVGLSQQAVAERLCLKVSTVRDIEDDRVNPNLASTFLRGYIRSYARLLHISEKELMPIMAKQIIIKTSNIESMRNFLLRKANQKHDGWLIRFTWFIMFVVISMTGIWWWQSRQIQQQEISKIAHRSSSHLTKEDNAILVPLGGNVNDISQSLVDQPTNIEAPSTHSTTPASTTIANLSVPQNTALEPIPTTTKVGGMDINSNTLVMNFTGDCWLEVLDADNKKLFSGIQHSGATLNLTGQASYKLKIGAPAAVKIQYKGKPVNLGQFIRSNQIARLTIVAQ